MSKDRILSQSVYFPSKDRIVSAKRPYILSFRTVYFTQSLFFSLIHYVNSTFRTTNSDGRTDTPVVSAGEFLTLLSRSAQYFKIEFDLASYYSDQTVFFPKADLVFYVGMDQREEHFHVPLLCTPFSYNTYRGS